MVCESGTGFLLRFIICTEASTVYQESTKENHSNPSKVVISSLYGFYNKGYCVALDNYYTSPEIAK